jgi:hypothetical protein
VLKYSSDVLYNIYIIYISVKSLSRFRSKIFLKIYEVIYIENKKKIQGSTKQIFFKKIYEVISIINKKKTLFKGFTRGDPWVPSLTKQNLNRTQKNKVIALKKIKRTF